MRTVNLTVCAILGIAIGHASLAASSKLSLRIESKPMQLALKDLGQQTGLSIVFRTEGISWSELRAPGIAGELTAQEALEKMLANTGLSYKFVNANTVWVVGKDELKAETAALDSKIGGITLVQSQAAQQGGASGSTDSSAAQSNASARTASSPSGPRIEEIIVTATKRRESIQDVPMSITAITSDDIDRRGLVGAEDYLRGIPGVNQITDANLGGSIVIRGIQSSFNFQNLEQGGTTAATYFGETPTSSSAGLAGNAGIDAKLVDIERVEVLRGPQGTAFGSAALGGVVRTIPVAPQLDQFEGEVGVNYSVTSGSGGDNNMIRAMVNAPLIQDKLAVRASAYRFDDSGFYSNAASSNPIYHATADFWGAGAFAVDEEEVGATNFSGGRIAGSFLATDALKFTVSYLKQKTEVDGVGVATAGLYQQTKLQIAPEQVRRGQGSGFSDTDIDLINATMEYDLGWSDLLATYSHVESGSMFATPFDFLPALPWSAFADSEHRAHSGEIRLTTKLQGAWNFLGGLYIEDLDDNYFQDTYWYGDPQLNFFQPGVAGRISTYYDTRNLKQKAAFGEASWEFLPKFTLTGGVRVYDYERTGSVDQNFFGVPAAFVRDISASDNSFSGNLSYTPSDGALLYARWAQGFRLGRPQIGLTPGLCDADQDGIVDGLGVTIESTRTIGSDDVDSYELGSKVTLLDRRLDIAANVFRMDWNGLPVSVFVPSCTSTYTANVGSARSDGIELQASIYATEALRVDVGGSWIDAQITQDVPVQGFTSGDRLPGAPEFNANLSLQYGFQIAGHEAFVRTDSIYVGPFYGAILSGAEAGALVGSGDYVKVDVSARITFGSTDVDLFVRNLTNADEFSFGGGNLANPFEGYRLRPRTIGIQAAHKF